MLAPVESRSRDQLFLIGTSVTSGSRGWAQYYSDDGATFIRVGNLDRNTISLDFQEVQRVNPPIGAEGTRTRVKTGDILVSITADIGMIALAPEDLPEAYINQHIALVRPLPSVYANYFAWYLASSEDGYKQFQQLQRGATKVGLGLDDIRSVWIPIPPLTEQKLIVTAIESIFKTIDHIQQQYEVAKAQLEKLDRAILAQAFRGELVPQDPNDEPASVLLDRIREERAKVSDRKSTKRKR
ncbi:MAG: restriction endonuclease subunit S [Myxacorys chilensis ATA2-1-KO14]|nr:restriction endonuclease subunit S [Myxacorys chilensis ATA2-1-KO14]